MSAEQTSAFAKVFNMLKISKPVTAPAVPAECEPIMTCPCDDGDGCDGCVRPGYCKYCGHYEYNPKPTAGDSLGAPTCPCDEGDGCDGCDDAGHCKYCGGWDGQYETDSDDESDDDDDAGSDLEKISKEDWEKESSDSMEQYQ